MSDNSMFDDGWPKGWQFMGTAPAYEYIAISHPDPGVSVSYILTVRCSYCRSKIAKYEYGIMVLNCPQCGAPID